MSKNYGPMVSYQTAINWIENLKGVDDNLKERTLARMEYEADKAKPVVPKFHKGKYGKQYDSYTCGNCGITIRDGVTSNYCNNCGFAIKWDNPRCLTGVEES